MAVYECNDTMRNFLRDLPKCEHHLHLEGTLEPDLLYPLAQRNNVKLPEQFPKTVAELEERYSRFKDLQDFLDFYYIGCEVLLKEEDFFDLAWAYFTRAHSQGLKHAEVFFDPQSHTARGVSIETVVGGFQRACVKARLELQISSKLIMCLLRHTPVEECMATLESSRVLFETKQLHALGLDSAEKPFPPEIFTECYEKASEFHPDIKLTAHAGEEGDASYVTNSLDLLRVTRIDHGVNSVQDPELMERLAREKVMLTVCPLSNVKLQVVKDVREIPLNKLLDAGVPFSLNSDDPAYFGGYILDNYVAVHSRFNWSLEIWQKVVLQSIEGSWCDDKRKNELSDELSAVVKKYKNLV
ncbi:LANO_0E11738g1_1 [Lachancea nothofagi CBS 11611]|uniref:Adenine deaminase n=1 Tax=Lachancea nothofagi CBS 11611 TaxID=1266666 RepID=A0A1G4JXX5_9SACH|nr:LANO_0E11738g1_1 [Lachancea nothofagi CBS 11611]